MKIARYPHDHEVIKPPASLMGKKIIFLPKGAEVIESGEYDVTHMDWVISECVKYPFILDLSNITKENYE